MYLAGNFHGLLFGGEELAVVVRHLAPLIDLPVDVDTYRAGLKGLPLIVEANGSSRWWRISVAGMVMMPIAPVP